MKQPLELPNYAKTCIVILGIFAIVTAFYLLANIVLPLVFAVILGIVLSPMVDFFVRKGCNRVVAIAITLFLLLLFSSVLFVLISTQLIQFSDSFPMLMKKLEAINQQTVQWVSETFQIDTKQINRWISDKSSEMQTNSGSVIGTTLMNTGNLLFLLLLIPVYIFMILYYKPLLLHAIHQIFKTHNPHQLDEVLSQTKTVIQKYLVGLLIEAGIVAILNITSLLIIGIEYAVVIGLLGALLNVIPYLGGIIAVSIPMLLAFVSHDSPTTAFLVLGAYLLIQLIDNNYIIPKIVASKVKINGLVSILVVICGGALWGIPGMFISIPLTAILKVIFDHSVSLKPWGLLLGDAMPVEK